jgi:hypothetical protein
MSDGEVAMSGGFDVLVEVRPDPRQGGNLAGQSFIERFSDRVDELGASLSDIANRLREQLEARMSSRPTAAWDLDEMGLSFSLDLQADAGVVLARAGTKAGFEASLTWKRKP